MPRRHGMGGLRRRSAALAFAQLRTRAGVHAPTVERLTRAGVTRVRRGGALSGVQLTDCCRLRQL